MKKNIAMRVASLILMCTIVSSCFVGSTFAKYTSSASGSSNATVAKWDVKVNGTNVNSVNPATFNLFDKSTVYQLAGIDTGTNASGWTKNDDANVKDGSDRAIVAPGTWGVVSFQVTNNSDVKATYAVVISALSTTLPLEFSTDGETWTSASSITPLPYNLGSGTLEIGDSTGETVNLYWRWLFDISDDANTADTGLGVTGTATCNITVNAEFTQVD
ncbi:MAG: hypothetical protein PUD72_05465 [Oscillospiraceae bacterium]|nr:hypothetical protein [Oscillospiraceae bacterium]